MDRFNSFSENIYRCYVEIKYIKECIDESAKDISRRFRQKKYSCQEYSIDIIEKRNSVKTRDVVIYIPPRIPKPPNTTPEYKKPSSLEDMDNPYYSKANTPLFPSGGKRQLLRKLYKHISLIIHPDKSKKIYKPLFSGVAMSEVQDAYDRKDLSLMISLYHHHNGNGVIKKIDLVDIEVASIILKMLMEHLITLRGNRVYEFNNLSEKFKEMLHGVWFNQ